MAAARRWPSWPWRNASWTTSRALLEEAERQFARYNTEVTDDPDAMNHVARPCVQLSRDFGAAAGRWSVTVERDDIPLGYAIEFDGLRHVRTWAAS